MIVAVSEQLASLEVERSDDVMNGTPVFRGTKVPVKTLFDYLVAGRTLDEFVRDFRTVSRRQALRVLRDAEAAVVGRG
jgi:uncharacterized protein (DUF433 family)